MSPHWSEQYTPKDRVGIEDYRDTVAAYEETNPAFFQDLQEEADFDALLTLLSAPVKEMSEAPSATTLLERVKKLASLSETKHADAIKKIITNEEAFSALMTSNRSELIYHINLALPILLTSSEASHYPAAFRGLLYEDILLDDDLRSSLPTECLESAYRLITPDLTDRIPQAAYDPNRYGKEYRLVTELEVLLWEEPHAHYLKEPLTTVLKTYFLSVPPQNLFSTPLFKFIDGHTDQYGHLRFMQGFKEVKDAFYSYAEGVLKENGFPPEWVHAWTRNQIGEQPFYFAHQNLSALFSLHHERPGSPQLLYNEYGIVNFARYPLDILINQVDLHTKQVPYGLVVNAHTDWNGALGSYPAQAVLTGFHAQVKDALPIRIIEIANRRDGARKLIMLDDRFGDEHKPEYVLVRAHGSPEVIEFSDSFKGFDRANSLTKEFVESLRFSRIAEILPESPVIILQSCSTGKSKGIGQSIARSIPGSSVIAPTKNAGASNLSYDRTKKGRQAFSISYVLDGVPVEAKLFAAEEEITL
jgi:hypothetical protein